MRFLWLHGIPGAGKTVLLSHVVEDMRNHCKPSDGRPSDNRIAWGYYYCYFGRAQDETPHMIRWVLSQLCRQMKDIPLEVSELYEEGGQPTTAQLMDTLRTVLRSFKRIYLMIDALDESLERENILNFLVGIINHKQQEFAGVQVLATSRKEHDIERALLNVSTDISLSNHYVDEDIRVFIQHRLRDDRKFNRWSQELRSEIEDALVGGAKGMYDVAVLSYLTSLDLLSL
jgi:Cdc6-like AAA superfamily ATPase